MMCVYLRLTGGKEDVKFIEGHKPLNPLLASVLALSVSIGIAFLLCMHVYLLRNNHTSLESGYLLMSGNPYYKGTDENVR